MAEAEERDDENWIERNSKTITTLATVSIPVVIAIFGYFANRSLQQDELDQSYVELAINTLKTELPVNERNDCLNKVRGLLNDPEEDFETATDLADAFQDEVSQSASTSTGTDLPQTLFRSYALDLLLTSTPATLTVPQYTALLCARTLVPPLSDPPVETGTGAEESAATSELGSRLEANADDTDADCKIRVTDGEVDTVGGASLSASSNEYEVTRSAVIQSSAPTEVQGGSTLPPVDVLYLEVQVDADGADAATPFWIQWQPNVEILPDRATCEP